MEGRGAQVVVCWLLVGGEGGDRRGIPELVMDTVQAGGRARRGEVSVRSESGRWSVCSSGKEGRKALKKAWRVLYGWLGTRRWRTNGRESSVVLCARAKASSAAGARRSSVW